MKGDFSRDTFDRQHRFARVLMQQGRVLLDADWNEQASILLHHLRTLAADLIGPHGGPGEGFKILCTDGNGENLECDFLIGWGHYYVDGILCENDPPRRRCPRGEQTEKNGAEGLRYTEQPHYPLPEEEEDKDEERLAADTSCLVYLDVWERHLTHLEAERIREPALGGPDTATRAQVVWQVRVAPPDECEQETEDCARLFERLVERLAEGRPPCLRAQARVEEPSDDPCIIPPEARYRGAENQLYRVEIHDEGTAAENGRNAPKTGKATFKWSRDNGSVVFGIRSLQGSTAALDSLGPDERRGLKEGDWVEIVDDRSVLRFEPRPLARVEAVDRVGFTVRLAAQGDLPDFTEESTNHPLLRRWDQGSKALPVEEGMWLDLEDGVQVWFERGGTYRTADYWLIPARTATGDVLWPTAEGPDGTTQPQALPPHGIEHHYAPLARIDLDGKGNVTCEEDSDCRCTFTQLCDADAGQGPEPPVEQPPPEEPVKELPRVFRPVTDIDDVGTGFARRLEAAGITDAAGVARLGAPELAGILTPPGGRRVPETRAASIIESAKRLSSG